MRGVRGSGEEATAAVERCLAAIEERDALLRAVITPLAEEARAAATRCDTAARRGERLGPLHGVPVAVKDNIAVAGVPTTNGAPRLWWTMPSQDAEVVRRLRGAGAIIVATLNMAEWALGGTTENRTHGSCRNPWDPDRTAGGSSGGSAAAVAAGMCDGALGTDTGGSVRVPAALCGLVGYRPTLGRFSNRGVTPVSTNFDTVGPMARHVPDVQRLAAVLDAFDIHDPTAVRGPREDLGTVPFTALHGLRMGVPTAFTEDLDEGVAAAFEDALGALRELGVDLVEVAIDGLETAHTWMRAMLYPDAAAFHLERLRSAPQHFADDVRERLAAGLQADAVEYARAVRWRQAFVRRVEDAFRSVDALVAPTTPIPAPLLDGAAIVEVTHRLTRHTYGLSLAGLPALSVPCGSTAGGLPVGLQVLTAPWHDGLLFRVGRAFEEAAGPFPVQGTSRTSP